MRNSLVALATALAITLPIASSARADDDSKVRFVAAVAPVAVGLFGVGTDGHLDNTPTAFGGRLGLMYAPDRHFQVGLDGTVLAPYGGLVVHYATQLAVRGALPLGDYFELGLDARLGPGFARVESGHGQQKTSTPTGPGPAITYVGWLAGVAIDATVWVDRNVALVFALEAIIGNEKNTAGNDVYLSYLQSSLAPFALAPWIGVQIGL